MGSTLDHAARRGRDAAIVLACVVAVASAAAVQLFVVMAIDPVPQFFAVPSLIGLAFGALIVRSRRAVQRQQQLAAELAQRERALADLNRELETKVVERTRDLEQAHEQLIHAQRMEAVGRVAGGIAHDFNNMLTVMFGCAAQLERAVANDEARAAVAELSAACERARQITRQLLIFSRRDEAHSTRVQLSTMLDALRPLLTRLVGHDVDLRVVVESDEAVCCDKGQLEQVVVNLVVNARDAGAKNVVLEVGQGIEPSAAPMARLSVRDDGLGMSPETARRALEPFFTTKPSGKGTGLGLSVADGVLRAFGGSVALSSTLGSGTTVTLQLPAAGPARAEVEPVHPPQTSAAPPARLSILVVEDEAAVRSIVVRTLEGCGYSVVAVETVRAALEVIADAAQRVDLLVTDYQLPDGTGAGVLDALERHRPHVPRVVTTGYVRSDDGRLADVLVLLKPFTPSALKESVDLALRAQAERAATG